MATKEAISKRLSDLTTRRNALFTAQSEVQHTLALAREAAEKDLRDVPLQNLAAEARRGEKARAEVEAQDAMLAELSQRMTALDAEEAPLQRQACMFDDYEKRQALFDAAAIVAKRLEALVESLRPYEAARRALGGYCAYFYAETTRPRQQLQLGQYHRAASAEQQALDRLAEHLATMED
jgi:uncharacterized protein YmfQ (DUF2313 family)